MKRSRPFQKWSNNKAEYSAKSSREGAAVVRGTAEEWFCTAWHAQRHRDNQAAKQPLAATARTVTGRSHRLRQMVHLRASSSSSESSSAAAFAFAPLPASITQKSMSSATGRLCKVGI